MVYHDIPFSIQSRMIIHGRRDLQMVVVSPAKTGELAIHQPKIWSKKPVESCCGEDCWFHREI